MLISQKLKRNINLKYKNSLWLKIDLADKFHNMLQVAINKLKSYSNLVLFLYMDSLWLDKEKV
jgi:hypothetical protein